MKVLKFGGSSIKTPELVKNVTDIIKAAKAKDDISVVVSAFGGITDLLTAAAHKAEKGDLSYKQDLTEYTSIHLDMVNTLISGDAHRDAMKVVDKYVSRLSDILYGVSLVKDLAPKSFNQILSYGERLSARIISAYLNSNGVDAEYLDARKVIRTDSAYGSAEVDFKVTNSKIRKRYKNRDKVQVVTGFIATNIEGETTLVGRSGSDFTAAIIGAALKVAEIEIWTDVDGIMTANPKQVEKAHPILEMTYEEAMEMSHFGAKVLFPPTIQPAMQLDIPIRIKNTFNPEFPGTAIDRIGGKTDKYITGISSLDSISLIRIQGSGMVGKTGLTGRIFTTIANANVGVMLISLASSEHSICFAVEPDNAQIAKKALELEFKTELSQKHIAKIMVEDKLCIVAVVGDHMRRIPGIAGQVFSVLGDIQVNVVAIAQGSSERNISIVVAKNDVTQVMQVLHDTFF